MAQVSLLQFDIFLEVDHLVQTQGVGQTQALSQRLTDKNLDDHVANVDDFRTNCLWRFAVDRRMKIRLVCDKHK
jgi:hypothetical protein